jgi:hypothetical protein
LPNYCYMIDDILNTILSFIIEKNKWKKKFFTLYIQIF